MSEVPKGMTRTTCSVDSADPQGSGTWRWFFQCCLEKTRIEEINLPKVYEQFVDKRE